MTPEEAKAWEHLVDIFNQHRVAHLDYPGYVTVESRDAILAADAELKRLRELELWILKHPFDRGEVILESFQDRRRAGIGA